jgi:hypothetical protein
MRALDDLEGRTVVLEFTVYSLSPHDEEDPEHQRTKIASLSERRRHTTPDQIRTVRDFLSFVSVNARNAEWLKPFVDSALTTIWLA